MKLREKGGSQEWKKWEVGGLDPHVPHLLIDSILRLQDCEVTWSLLLGQENQKKYSNLVMNQKSYQKVILLPR